jgi:hypothetical protein
MGSSASVGREGVLLLTVSDDRVTRNIWGVNSSGQVLCVKSFEVYGCLENSFERELEGRVYIGQKMNLKVCKAGVPRN